MMDTASRFAVSGIHAALALILLMTGFGGILFWRWIRFRWLFRDHHAAIRRAIESADGQRSVSSAERMIVVIHRAHLDTAGQARLQPELARLERAVQRSSSSWTAFEPDPVGSRSEFATALSAFIAKARTTPLDLVARALPSGSGYSQPESR